jgi:hypothetical protein
VAGLKDIRGVSDEVLEGLAHALQLDDVERAHLIDLVRMANASPAARARSHARYRPIAGPAEPLPRFHPHAE